MEFGLLDNNVKISIERLRNIIRAERNRSLNAIETYAEPDLIDKFTNTSNQVVFGRRGTGKTHLLFAIRERLIDNFNSNKNIGIYCDLSKIIPIIEETEENLVEYCLLILKNLVEEIIKQITDNLQYIHSDEYFFSSDNTYAKIKSQLNNLLTEFNFQINDGSEIKKIGTYGFSSETISSLKTSQGLSTTSSDLQIARDKQSKENSEDKNIKYISVSDLHNLLKGFSDIIPGLQITLLLDEFSEVSFESQPYLAALLKRVIISAEVTVKIAAIPHRTNLQLRSTNIIGLEEGADIFGFHLDNRYIYEINKFPTKSFFNKLLINHLNTINPELFPVSEHNILGIFLAPQAMNEILIATAGIPRDFLNIFISSYDNFTINHTPAQKRISVRNVRAACRTWYNTDKKDQVEKNFVAHKLLSLILSDIVVLKKSSHFLVPQKYTEIKAFQDLLDLRVLHLRKENYSHQDIKGTVYNVYSVDYGSYNSMEITKNSFDTNSVEDIELNTIDDLRKVRRISLEDDFFNRFLLEVGEGIRCKHCKNTIDTNSPAFEKKKLCNHCFESQE